MNKNSELVGILPLNKPKGLTSHDCVIKIRKLLHVKKVGHTGTLDPEASGVLPICIGRATKVVEYMADYDKTYEAVVTLGSATTTEDAAGEIIEQKDITAPITPEEIRLVLQDMTGLIEQVPPMYSAVKVGGKRLYEYAFQGEVIERPKRKVNIYKLELLSEHPVDNDNRSFAIRAACSKGTYIRTLAVDIGKKLGYPAHLADLKRVQSGPFTIEDTVTFKDIETAVENGQIAALLHSIDKAVAHFDKIVVSDELAQKIQHGAVIRQSKNMQAKRTAIYNSTGELLAIYIPHPKKTGYLKPEKVIKVIN